MSRRSSVVAIALLTVGCARCGPRGNKGELDLGPAVRIPAHRVVTLAPSLTELILALGAADRVVGVTKYDDAPEVARVPRVGGYSDPETEAVLRVSPDLIICQPSPGNRGAVEALARSGIPVVVLPLTTLEDVETATIRIGALLGLGDQASKEVERLRSAREAARAAALRRTHRPRVAVFVDLNPLVAAGPGSFVHEMLVDAGADDVIEASTQPYPRVSIESFLLRKPDGILLALMPGQNASAEPLPGVKAPAIVLHSAGFMHPGPLVPEALKELTGILDSLAGR